MMGMNQVDRATLLPACAASWNLSNGKRFGSKYLPARRIPRRTYQSSDGYFVVEPPLGWLQRRHDTSNEVTFAKGKISVSIATVNRDPGDSVEKFIEFKKSMMRHLCPAGKIWEEGRTMVAGAPGAFFTFYCPNSHTCIHVAASLNCGRFFVFKIGAPNEESPAAEAEIARIAQSFKPGEASMEECEPLQRAS